MSSTKVMKKHDTLCFCAPWCNQLWCSSVQLCNCATVRLCTSRGFEREEVAQSWGQPVAVGRTNPLMLSRGYPPFPKIHTIDETLIHNHKSQSRAGKRVVFQRAESIRVYIAGWLRGQKLMPSTLRWLGRLLMQQLAQLHTLANQPFPCRLQRVFHINWSTFWHFGL